MSWYKQHFRAIVLGIIVLAILSMMVASYIHDGSNSWIGRGMAKISAFIQEPLAKGEKNIATSFKGVFRYKDLIDENQALEEENDRLKRELMNYARSEYLLEELKDLVGALDYLDPSEEYEYVAGSVIAMDGSGWYRIFTVNAGKEKGVKKNSIVINGDGLVGRVIDTGTGWSKIISIIDENNSVSFQIFRDMSLLGILKGGGNGKVEGYMLDETASLVEGDLVITSGIGIYPQGIPIGTISKITRGSGGLLNKVEIEPAVNFNSIQNLGILITEALEEL